MVLLMTMNTRKDSLAIQENVRLRLSKIENDMLPELNLGWMVTD